MNIRKIIKERMDDFDWTADVGPLTILDIAVSGNRYNIIDLPSSEYEEYYSDRNIKKYNIFDTVFVIDDDPFTLSGDVWVMPEGVNDGVWLSHPDKIYVRLL